MIEPTRANGSGVRVGSPLSTSTGVPMSPTVEATRTVSRWLPGSMAGDGEMPTVRNTTTHSVKCLGTNLNKWHKASENPV